MKLVNLCPHIVRIYLGDHPQPLLDRRPEAWVILPKSDQVAHIDQARDERHTIAGVPLLRWVIGDTTELPDPRPGVIYVVSSLVGREVVRRDVVSPDAKYRPILDEHDNIYAVRRLQQWTRGRK